MLLRAGIGWKPGLVGHAHVGTDGGSQAGHALLSNEPVIVNDLRKETRFRGARLLHEHGIISGISVTITGRDGRAYGILGAHSQHFRQFGERDVSFLLAVANIIASVIHRQQMDIRQELMIRELRHRSGNLFSQLLALFSQTAKSSRSIAELTDKYPARVLALANAHRLITEGGWRSTSLVELLRGLLGPFLNQVTFTGPNVYLEPDPTFGLSAAVHELTTNASKHGSLSRPEGRLELSWVVERSDRGMMLRFDWRELGGPLIRQPRRFGFGSRLMTVVIERQLNGKIQHEYRRQGLHAVLQIPLGHERWPTSQRHSEQFAPYNLYP